MSLTSSEIDKYYKGCYFKYDDVPVYMYDVGSNVVLTRESQDHLVIRPSQFDERKVSGSMLNGFYRVGNTVYILDTITGRQWKRCTYLGGTGRSSNTKVSRVSFTSTGGFSVSPCSMTSTLHHLIQTENSSRTKFITPIDTAVPRSLLLVSEYELLIKKGNSVLYSTLYDTTLVTFNDNTSGDVHIDRLLGVSHESK